MLGLDEFLLLYARVMRAAVGGARNEQREHGEKQQHQVHGERAQRGGRRERLAAEARSEPPPDEGNEKDGESGKQPEGRGPQIRSHDQRPSDSLGGGARRFQATGL